MLGNKVTQSAATPKTEIKINLEVNTGSGANSIRAYTASGETVTSTLTVTCSVTTIRGTTSAKVTVRSGQSSGSKLYATGELVSAYIVSGTPLEDSNHYYTYL